MKVLAKLKSITHELESKELDTAAKNLQASLSVEMCYRRQAVLCSSRQAVLCTGNVVAAIVVLVVAPAPPAADGVFHSDRIAALAAVVCLGRVVGVAVFSHEGNGSRRWLLLFLLRVSVPASSLLMRSSLALPRPCFTDGAPSRSEEFISLTLSVSFSFSFFVSLLLLRDQTTSTGPCLCDTSFLPSSCFPPAAASAAAVAPAGVQRLLGAGAAGPVRARRGEVPAGGGAHAGVLRHPVRAQRGRSPAEPLCLLRRNTGTVRYVCMDHSLQQHGRPRVKDTTFLPVGVEVSSRSPERCHF